MQSVKKRSDHDSQDLSLNCLHYLNVISTEAAEKIMSRRP